MKFIERAFHYPKNTFSIVISSKRFRCFALVWDTAVWLIIRINWLFEILWMRFFADDSLNICQTVDSGAFKLNGDRSGDGEQQA
jgi:hypothetical protein